MLKNPEFLYLIKSFEKWLNTLEYAQSTVNVSVSYLRDFFEFLEKNKLNNINEIITIHDKLNNIECFLDLTNFPIPTPTITRPQTQPDPVRI